ncbi:MAG: tripartite tricarboxylate transporter substrate-binding protein [Pseudomonadota bacterium]
MDSINRRGALALGIGSAVLAQSARAQAPWPTQPVRLIVPYAAGGPSDIIARSLQTPLQSVLGQSVVIENRAGGGAIIGSEAAARSTDGHTFLVADSPHTIIPAVQARVPYDPAGDFKPVSLVGAVTMLLMVNAGLPSRSFAAFIADAKARPEAVTFGSSGVGSLTDLLPKWLGLLAGARFTTVPYRGSGPALLDVVAGQINAIFSSTLAASGPLRDGQVRPLGAASVARLAAFPDVPTLREQGIDLVSSNWWGVLAAKANSATAVERMNAALNVALADPGVVERFAALGIEARPRGAAPFAELLASEFTNWARVAQDAGVRVQ